MSVLRAAGEDTRLRLLALLAEGELNVTEIAQIVGQSQPRISRHLKLLAEAGLIERYREGSWVCVRIADSGPQAQLLQQLIGKIDRGDLLVARDRARAEAAAKARIKAAMEYFRSHATDWDRIRSLHVDELRVEEEMLAAAGAEPFDVLIDLGTGTGRVLELFAPRIQRGVGLDISPEMLALARAKLDRSHLRHCQARHGDLSATRFGDATAGLVTLHQVLHFLENPAGAIAEAARLLAPGGCLLIVDFATHEHEFLRTEFAHRRLGFDPKQVEQWIADAGLGGLSVRQLPPPKGYPESEGLTVLIWTATKPIAQKSHAPHGARTREHA